MYRLEQSEQEALYEIIESLTGTCQAGSFKKDVLSSNVERRINSLGEPSFSSYLKLISDDDYEFQQFLSLVTIHTTYWFRENPHFKRLEDEVLKLMMSSQGPVRLKIWSAACSTGQEAYSIAFVLETICSLYPQLSYEIYASDIDPVSVNKAREGQYPINQLKTIPNQFQNCIVVKDQFFNIKDKVKNKVTFFTGSLLDDHLARFENSLDFIFCRNVLIYFNSQSTLNAVNSFNRYLNAKGLLVLGHSENFDTSKTDFELVGNSCYKKRIKESSFDRKSEEPFLKVFSHPQIIAIGASTGGPETLEVFLRDFPKPCPPVIIVQHINSAFCESFARRMAAISGLECRDTRKKIPLTPDGIYIAWGDYHLTVVEENNLFYIQPSNQTQRNGHRPSVDILFESLAKIRARCIGVLLTGMGRDGAEGLLKMKQSRRCLTMAQNKESSVVFGMPKEAIDLGAAHMIGNAKYLSQVVKDFVMQKVGLVKAS
jgi:chemotaxis protein methyltransferase CheR